MQAMQPRFTADDYVQFTGGAAAGSYGFVKYVHTDAVTPAYDVRLTDGRLARQVRESYLTLAPKPKSDEHARPEDLDKIIDRIKKLNAHAESAQAIGSEAEAQSFADAVQKMLMKYKLTMSDVLFATIDKDDPIGEQFVSATKHGLQERRTRMGWIERLAGAVARAHYCRILVHPRSADVTFIGRKTDREIAEFVFVTLQRSAHKLADQEYAAYYRKWAKLGEPERARGYRASWLNAYVTRVAHRYLEEEEALKKHYASQGVSLVRLSDAVVKVDEFMKRELRGLRTLRGVSGKVRGHQDGIRDGTRAGNNANLRGTGLAGAPTRNGLGAGQRQLPPGKRS